MVVAVLLTYCQQKQHMLLLESSVAPQSAMIPILGLVQHLENIPLLLCLPAAAAVAGHLQVILVLPIAGYLQV
jgi:hypothetical protein